MTVLARLIALRPRTDGPYRELPITVRAADVVLRRLPDDAGERYLDRTARRLAKDMPVRPVPELFLPAVLDERERIMRGERAQPWCRSLLSDDSFLKDLALARGVLVPAGQGVYERMPGGDHKDQIAVGQPFCERSAAIQSAYLAAQPPYLCRHLSVRHRALFSHAARVEGNLWTAEFLRNDESLWGSVGRTWYSDPLLPRRGDRPQFYEQVYNNGGALVLGPSDDHAIELALLDSPERQAAYDAGTYLPRWCTMLWPRDAAIAWADAELARTGATRPRYPWEFGQASVP